MSFVKYFTTEIPRSYGKDAFSLSWFKKWSPLFMVRGYHGNVQS